MKDVYRVSVSGTPDGKDAPLFLTDNLGRDLPKLVKGFHAEFPEKDVGFIYFEKTQMLVGDEDLPAKPKEKTALDH